MGVSSASASPPTPSLPLELEAAAALGVQPNEGEVFVRTDVLRGHPVGAHSGLVFAMWRGWRDTLRAIARDPLTDLDWIDVVAPSDAAHGRMLAFASQTGDAAIDGRLVALGARSAEPAAGHVEGSPLAAAARLDGVLRVLFRPEPRLIAAAAAPRGPSVSHALLHAHVHAPALWPHEALRADLHHPHDSLPALPPEILRLKANVLMLPNGDAEATADGECANAGDAQRAASSIRETIARQNNPIVQMLTRGILDGLTVSVHAGTVSMHIHANRDQLEALLALASASVTMAPP